MAKGAGAHQINIVPQKNSDVFKVCSSVYQFRQTSQFLRGGEDKGVLPPGIPVGVCGQSPIRHLFLFPDGVQNDIRSHGHFSAIPIQGLGVVGVVGPAHQHIAFPGQGVVIGDGSVLLCGGEDVFLGIPAEMAAVGVQDNFRFHGYLTHGHAVGSCGDQGGHAGGIGSDDVVRTDRGNVGIVAFPTAAQGGQNVVQVDLLADGKLHVVKIDAHAGVLGNGHPAAGRDPGLQVAGGHIGSAHADGGHAAIGLVYRDHHVLVAAAPDHLGVLPCAGVYACADGKAPALVQGDGGGGDRHAADLRLPDCIQLQVLVQSQPGQGAVCPVRRIGGPVRVLVRAPAQEIVVPQGGDHVRHGNDPGRKTIDGVRRAADAAAVGIIGDGIGVRCQGSHGKTAQQKTQA